jgi:hypothetical protein
MTSALSEKKRPGQDCNPAEPRSTAKPSKGKPMNAHTNTTQTAEPATRLLIDAIDELGPVQDLLEAIFMAATTLTAEECGAIQTVAGAASDKLAAAKGILYDLHARNVA